MTVNNDTRKLTTDLNLLKKWYFIPVMWFIGDARNVRE